MAIPFTTFPADTLVPNVYIEVDNSRAEQGPEIQPYTILVIGQRLAAGTKSAGTLDQVVDASQGRQFYGPGSMITKMLDKVFDVNKATDVFAVSLDDDGGAAAAGGELLFGGAPTAAGTLYLYIGGIRYKVAVGSTDTAANVATAVAAAITADADAVVSAIVNGGVPEQVDVTARNLGEAANQIDIRYNYFEGENLPTGLTAIVQTAMTGGTANPDLTTAFAALTEDQFNILAVPYTDAANLVVLDNEMDDRFGPIRQNFGVSFMGLRDTVSNLLTFVSSKNSKNYSIMGMAGPHSPWEWAAQEAGQISLAAQNDPARPFQTLPLPTILAPTESEQFSFSERQLLLEDGISTYNVVGGDVLMERMVTTYKTNAFAAVDDSFKDVNTLLTLEYIRYDFRRQWLLTYPRAKLASDGVNLGPGGDNVVVTPLSAKGFVVSMFRGWEQLGLVENFDQFKRDLVVERDSADKNRLSILLPPDLVNQLRVTSVLLQFRL